MTGETSDILDEIAAERERFWRQDGWTPDLPEEQRREIEESWDAGVLEALAQGF